MKKEVSVSEIIDMCYNKKVAYRRGPVGFCVLFGSKITEQRYYRNAIGGMYG